MTEESRALGSKVIFLCALIIIATAVFSFSMNAIQEAAPYSQFGEYQTIENGTTNCTLKNVGEAFNFVRELEGNTTITLQNLGSNPLCDGYEYEIYVHSKDVKYIICQNGKYYITKAIPFGFEKLKQTINIIFADIEEKAISIYSRQRNLAEALQLITDDRIRKEEILAAQKLAEEKEMKIYQEKLSVEKQIKKEFDERSKVESKLRKKENELIYF